MKPGMFKSKLWKVSMTTLMLIPNSNIKFLRLLTVWLQVAFIICSNWPSSLIDRRVFFSIHNLFKSIEKDVTLKISNKFYGLTHEVSMHSDSWKFDNEPQRHSENENIVLHWYILMYVRNVNKKYIIVIKLKLNAVHKLDDLNFM